MNYVNLFFDTTQLVLPENMKCRYSDREYLEFDKLAKLVGSDDEPIFDLRLTEFHTDLFLAQLSLTSGLPIDDLVEEYLEQQDLAIFIMHYFDMNKPDYFIMHLSGEGTAMMELFRKMHETSGKFKKYKLGMIGLGTTEEIDSVLIYGHKRKHLDQETAEKFIKGLLIQYSEKKKLADTLIFELMALPLSDGPALEKFVETFLTACFSEAYEDGVTIHSQKRNSSGSDRRDFQITNSTDCKNAFLNHLRSRDHVDILLFDAKNYKAELTQDRMSRFRTYLDGNPYFGDFGVIISRKGVTKEAKQWLEKSWNNKEFKIIVLYDDDLIKMLTLYGNDKDPIAVIEKKYYDTINGL